MAKSRILHFIFIVCMVLSSTVITSYAKEEYTEYSAHIYHAIGVDEYGSNIVDVSTILSDVPVSIVQNGGNMEINLSLDGNDIALDATIRGRNISDNLLYFDSMNLSASSLEVMALTYIKDFSPNAVISQDYTDNHPEAKDVLQIYFKVLNEETREYYFVEIFNFELENFEELMGDAKRCDPDIWVMEEFIPVKRTILDTKTVQTRAHAYSEITPIRDEYFFAAKELYACIEVEKRDDMADIPVGGSEFWMHTVEIHDKYTICPSASEWDSDTSPLEIVNAELRATAPLNCAFLTSEIDGVAQKNPFAGALSASIGIGKGPLSVSLDLGSIISGFGKVNINETFDGYDNSDPNEMTRGVSVEFDDTHWLADPGDRYDVLVCVRDYGDRTTADNTVYTRWGLQIYNTQAFTMSNYSLIDDFTVRVG